MEVFVVAFLWVGASGRQTPSTALCSPHKPLTATAQLRWALVCSLLTLRCDFSSHPNYQTKRMPLRTAPVSKTESRGVQGSCPAQLLLSMLHIRPWQVWLQLEPAGLSHRSWVRDFLVDPRLHKLESLKLRERTVSGGCWKDISDRHWKLARN